MHRRLVATLAVLLIPLTPAFAARISSLTSDEIISTVVGVPSTFSAFLWYSPDHNANNSTADSVWQIGSNTGGVTQLDLNWDNTGGAKQQAWSIYTGSGFNVAQYTTTLSAGTFYPLAATYDGTNLKAYRGASLEATTASAAPAASTGAQVTLFTDVFADPSPKGTVSRATFWTGLILSKQEIYYLGNGGNPLSVRPSSLIEYLPLANNDTADHKLGTGLTQTVTGTADASEPSGLLNAAAAPWIPQKITATAFFPADTATTYELDSTDGINFVPRPVSFTPAHASFRDASTIWAQGKLWVAAGNHDIGAEGADSWDLASSTDNIGGVWTQVTSPSVTSVSGCTTTCDVWAPEWFADSDGSIHILVFVAPTGYLNGGQCYEMHPTNAAWTTWSNPVALTGTSMPTIYYDCFIEKIGSTYYLWAADYNGGSQGIFYATSSSPFSGYTIQATQLCKPGGGHSEGPVTVYLGGGKRRLYSDNLGLGAYYCDSTDNYATFGAATAVQINGASNVGSQVLQGLNPKILNPGSALLGAM